MPVPEIALRSSRGRRCHLAQILRGSLVITYQGETIDLTPPWRRVSFFQGLSEALRSPVGPDQDPRQIREAAARLGVEVSSRASPAKLWKELFETLVEPTLIQPTFVVEFPIGLSPLSKRSRENPVLADRFELFMARREMANAYTELNDPQEQRERFREQAREREMGDDEAHWLDEDFIRALEYGMPPTAGEGIGIDRLVMLFADRASIRDVILFPHLRPESRPGSESGGEDEA